MTLENALEQDPPLLAPLEPRVIGYRPPSSHSSRSHVVCMPENRPELLLEMVAESGTMGPCNVVWLRKRLDPNHVGTHVKTVLDIFGGVFADDIRGQVTAVESVITKARSLEGDFELNGILIALLIIFKLPETSSIRADLIVKNPLPTPAAILLQLQQIAAFAPGASVFNDPTGLLAAADDRRNGRSGRSYRNCHNCDGTDHQPTRASTARSPRPTAPSAASAPTTSTSTVSRSASARS
uniref:Uncharacterized protein n=1 Tax=Prymnesium polylepis TaxID=72548 RepID=A0A7S4HX47_9EUKA